MMGAAGISGCTTNVSSDRTDSTSASSSTPYPEGKQRRVSLNDQDTVSEEYDLRINVEVADSLITHQHTARLQITVTNEGPKRAISIQNPECDLLDRHKAGSDPPGLWLHPPGRTPPDQGLAERDGNRWVADFPTGQNRVFGDFRCGTRTYASDEELQNEYLVWDDYRIDGYLEPGTYRWEEPEIEITEDSEPVGTFSWRFSVTLEQIKH